MPTYKAPVESVLFLLQRRARLRALFQPAGLCRRAARHGRGGARGGGALLRGGAAAAEPRRRQGGLPAERRRLGHHADGFSRGLSRASSRRAGSGLRPIRNTAARACPMCSPRSSTSSPPPPTWRSACIRGCRRARSRRCTQHGSDEQKALYLPKLVSGEWSGTMNLTEPQCGTDLGLIKTKAVAGRRRQLHASPARKSSSRPASTT